MRKGYAPVSFDRAELLAERYLLATEGRYHVYYAPVGSWPREETRVLFLGITPGFAQVVAAADAYLHTAPAIRNNEDAFSDVLRNKVAYIGPMRDNLCRMLDDIDFPKAYGVKNSDELFAAKRTEITASSTLIFPVFQGPEMKNFSGVRNLSRSALFRTMLDKLLAPRVKRAPNALVIPLGVVAGDGVRYLCENYDLPSDRVLWHLPHPSPANGRRESEFKKYKKTMRAFIEAFFR